MPFKNAGHSLRAGCIGQNSVRKIKAPENNTGAAPASIKAGDVSGFLKSKALTCVTFVTKAAPGKIYFCFMKKAILSKVPALTF